MFMDQKVEAAILLHLSDLVVIQTDCSFKSSSLNIHRQTELRMQHRLNVITT